MRTVGYVRTGYATRNISDVLAEVSTYAGWSVKSSQLAMHGIFFDEAPHEYSASAVEFMRTINQFVKGATGLQGDRTVSSKRVSTLMRPDHILMPVVEDSWLTLGVHRRSSTTPAQSPMPASMTQTPTSLSSLSSPMRSIKWHRPTLQHFRSIDQNTRSWSIRFLPWARTI